MDWQAQLAWKCLSHPPFGGRFRPTT